MKIYKKTLHENRNVMRMILSFGLLLIALAALAYAVIPPSTEIKVMIGPISLLTIFLTLSGVMWYGSEEDIRLRSPQPGETIEILFTRNVTEKDKRGDDKQKTFYLYSVDEVIYSDEREPTLLELGKKYFVNKDGELELKE